MLLCVWRHQQIKGYGGQRIRIWWPLENNKCGGQVHFWLQELNRWPLLVSYCIQQEESSCLSDQGCCIATCCFKLDKAKANGITYCEVQSVEKIGCLEKSFKASHKRRKMSTALGRTCQKLLLMAANRNIQVVAFTFVSRKKVFVRLC